MPIEFRDGPDDTVRFVYKDAILIGRVTLLDAPARAMLPANALVWEYMNLGGTLQSYGGFPTAEEAAQALVAQLEKYPGLVCSKCNKFLESTDIAHTERNGFEVSYLGESSKPVKVYGFVRHFCKICHSVRLR